MRYLLQLSRTLGKSYAEVCAWDTREILLQMAYDKSQNREFAAAQAAAEERERQENMTQAERIAAFAEKLGVKIR